MSESSGKRKRTDESEEETQTTASGYRGETCKDAEAISKAMMTIAKTPIFISNPLSGGTDALIAQKTMWRQLEATQASLTFHKPSVKDALEIVRICQVQNGVEKGGWHRDLTSLEAIEYVETNMERFMVWATKIATTKRKRPTTGWLVQLLGDAPPEGAPPEGEKSSAPPATKESAPSSSPPTTKFDWSTKRAQRCINGIVMYAPLEDMEVNDDHVECRWPDEASNVKVEDVTVEDFILMKKAIAEKQGAATAEFEGELDGETLRVRSQKNGEMYVMRLGDKQLCQILVHHHPGGAKGAVALMTELAQDVVEKKILPSNAKMEKIQRLEKAAKAEGKPPASKNAKAEGTPTASKKAKVEGKATASKTAKAKGKPTASKKAKVEGKPTAPKKAKAKATAPKKAPTPQKTSASSASAMGQTEGEGMSADEDLSADDGPGAVGGDSSDDDAWVDLVFGA